MRPIFNSTFLKCRLVRKQLQNWPIINQYKKFASSAVAVSSNEFIVRSPNPEVPNLSGVTFPEYVRSQIGNWKDSIAFECGITGLKVTHDEVWKIAKGFTAALLNSELKNGDTVAIILPNHPFFASVLYGILDAGLIASPINPAYTPGEIGVQLLDSKSKCAVTIPAFIPAIRAAQKSNPNLKSIVVIGEPVEGCHTFTEMIKTDTKGVNFLKGSDIDPYDSVAIIPYSSGTTGLPKGVMLTHACLVNHLNIITQPDVFKIEMNSGNPERLVGLLPFFHMYGLTTYTSIGLVYGATTMCLPKFDPGTFLQTVRSFKPTILHLVPPLIGLIVASPDYGKTELDSVHTVVGAAAPIGPWLVKQMLAKAQKQFFFQEGYGMTEATTAVNLLRESSGMDKIGSCGYPVPNTSVKVVATDGSGKCMGPNQSGEICVKGPQVMKGYWNNEEATRNTIDSEGWLHTGDIGYYDSDNHFYIVDRLKELIKVKGFQVAPAELENLLRSHPGITDAAVIGINDPQSRELPRGYIVKKNNSLTPDEIHSFLEKEVTYYKQLKGGIEFVDCIPKSASGKILRKELKKMYLEQHAK